MNNPGFDRTDQGSQLVRPAFTGRKAPGIQIGMDGRGRALDNIFVERLWRSVKYEEVYRNEYDSPRAARGGLSGYLSFYNEVRPHQSLGYRTPAQVYRDPICLEREGIHLKLDPVTVLTK